MERLGYKTRGMSNPQGKQRVYFTCHPADFEIYFEKISEEILKLQNCAIWYDEFLIPGENFNEAIEVALKKSGLFALAVTPNLVNEENYVMSTE